MTTGCPRATGSCICPTGAGGWQAASRQLQCGWREDKGYEAGFRAPSYAPQDKSGAPVHQIGSCLTPQDGDSRRNLLTPAAISEAERAISEKERGAVLREDRIYRDLLSSQPLCFNAFGEISLPGREEVATAVFQRLWPDLVRRVTRIRYEHNPHRGPFGVIGTKSAFDVFVDIETPEGPGFIGIEVKYHENMSEPPISIQGKPPKTEAQRARSKARETALRSAAERLGPTLESLTSKGTSQVWLDHALALAMFDKKVQAEHHTHAGVPCLPAYKRGLFVMLAPSQNTPVWNAYRDYRTMIESRPAALATLDERTLEDFLDKCQEVDASATWPRLVRQRFLG